MKHLVNSKSYNIERTEQMANYDLDQTGQTDIQTTFRFELHLAADPANRALGLTEDVTG